jgi:hypothetical protein
MGVDITTQSKFTIAANDSVNFGFPRCRSSSAAISFAASSKVLSQTRMRENSAISTGRIPGQMRFLFDPAVFKIFVR